MVGGERGAESNGGVLIRCEMEGFDGKVVGVVAVDPDSHCDGEFRDGRQCEVTTVHGGENEGWFTSIGGNDQGSEALVGADPGACEVGQFGTGAKDQSIKTSVAGCCGGLREAMLIDGCRE